MPNVAKYVILDGPTAKYKACHGHVPRLIFLFLVNDFSKMGAKMEILWEKRKFLAKMGLKRNLPHQQAEF